MRVIFTFFLLFGVFSFNLAQVIQEKAACNNPIPIDFTVTITSNYNGQAISCNGLCDGEITVTINSAGGGPYGFEIFDGSTTATQAADVPGGGATSTFTGLCADNYNFTVIDSSQLIFGTIFESCTEFGVIISPPNNIGVNVLGFQDPSCPDSCDGRIFANIGGGTAPLSILWDNGSTLSSPTGVCTGANQVVVTDANSCTFTTIVTVNDPVQINFGMVIQPVSCDGICDAQAISSPTGANGAPFNFNWSQLPGNTAIGNASNVPSYAQGGLCENTDYILRLEDSNGCPFDTTITILDAIPISLASQVPTDATCANICNGEMIISLTGGSGTFTQVAWFEGLVGSGTLHDAGPSLQQTNLCANTDYYITVTDDNNCTRSFQLSQISSPPPFVFTETHTDVSCAGAEDAGINTTVTGGTPGYTYTWTSPDGGTGFSSSSPDQATISGGTYHVVWVDAQLCTDSADIIILEPDNIYSSAVVTNISCFDLLDGDIDVTTTGGNGGYVWTWTATTNGTSSLINPTLEDQTNLDSATYFLHIEDGLGCVYDTAIIISKPAELFFNAAVTQMDCFNDNDASITVNPANGVPAYVIDWGAPINDLNGPLTQTNLSADTYLITLTDNNGCDKDTAIVIIQPDELIVSETHQTITCFGDNDGEIDVTITGGTAPIEIIWTNSGGGSSIPGTTNTNPIGLLPGNYTATVTDANSCQIILNVAITEPDALSLTINGTDLTCNGVPNGNATLSNVTGGTVAGNYLFDWDNDAIGDFDDNQNLTNLLAGTYCVNIQDDNGCVLAIDSCVSIIEPDSIFFNGSVHTDITCFGDNDGSTTLSVSGGTETGTYDFDWTPTPGCYSGSTTNQNLSNLCEGTYVVTATDDNGCTNDTTFIIVEPPVLNISETHTSLECANINTGEIQITVSGGEGILNVSWSAIAPAIAPANNDLNPTGLSPGVYTATVTDANGCDNQVTITIDEPLPLSLTISGTDLTCNGVPDGTVSITPTGGTIAGNYTFDWDNDGTGDFNDPEDLTSLLAGTYCVNIQDDNNCVLLADSCFTIIEPDSIFFVGSTFTDMTCFGLDNGNINLNVSGGTIAGNYTFDWNNDGTGDFDDTQNQSGLSNGTYIVVAQDDNGCTNDTTFSVTEPIELIATTSSTDAGCGIDNGTANVVVSGGTVAGGYIINWTGPNGFTSSATNLTGLETGVYNVTITDDNGCTVTGQETISTITPPIVTINNQTDLLCNSECIGAFQITIAGGTAPYVISWAGTSLTNFSSTNEDIFGLCADDYTLSVTDANLCQEVQVLTIAEPTPLEITSSIVTDIDCFGNATGSIDISPTGGTIAGNYIFQWSGDNSMGATTEDVSGLLPGNYCVNFMDDNGCSLDLDSCFVITEPTALVIDNMSSTDAQCNVPNGSATVVASGGTVTTDYNYSWSPSGDVNATASNILSGVHTVTVTDDNGCTVSGSVAVIPTNGPAVTIDGFTDVTCAGANNGSISTTASGGTGSLTYTWSSIPAGFTAGNVPDVFGLPGGTYVVTVTDGAACNTSQVVTIAEPTPLAVIANITNANCFGNDGLIDITVSGGTNLLGYGFDWSNNGGSAFTDPEDLTFQAGSYTVNIVDDNGCTLLGGPYDILQPSEIDLATSSTTSACLQNDGTVSVTALNGTPGNAPNEYTYIWTDVSGTQVGNLATASNLPAGCYDVIVTENRANGCQMSTTECVSDINGPDLTSTEIAPSCFNVADGEIQLTVVSSSMPVTFVWSALNNSSISPNINAQNITGLTLDDYSVLATDDNGCISGLSVTFDQPDEISILADANGPLCSTTMDGYISLATIANVGLPIASTTWTGPSGFTSSSQDISGLAIGQYCLTLIDANGCQLDTCLTLTAPQGITIVTSSVDSDCSSPSGQVSATATGGNPAYTFTWSPGGNGNVINSLPAGIYDLVVSDLNGCSATAQQQVFESNAPSITVNSTNDIDCFGDSSGDIFVTVTGGTPNYTYDWDNLPGTTNPEDQTGLPAGTYNLTVTDNVGCSDVESVTLDEPNAPLAISGSQTDLLCNNGGTGEINITVTGGTPNYTYNWTESGAAFSNSTNATGLNTISNLDALVYDLIITDANGCTITDSYTLTEETPIILVSSSIDASCGNSDGEVSVTATGGNDGVTYTYAWIDFNTGTALVPGNTATVTGVPNGTYQVSVTDLNNCTVTSLATISDVGGPSVIASSTDVQCFGDANGTTDLTVTGNPTFGFSWTGPNTFTSTQEDLTGIEAGNYAVAVTDINGCVTNEVVVVDGPNSALAITGTDVDLTCFQDAGGSVDVTITGGTPTYTVDWSSLGGYTATTQDINSLVADTYTIDVEDANGCTLNGTQFFITEPNEIIITPTIVQPTCGVSDGSVTLAVTGGTIVTDYTYVWTDINAGTVMTGATTNSISSIDAGNYQIDITDANGCNITEVISVTNDQAPTLTIVQTDIDCFGNNTGAIDVTVNGTAPNTYTFDWDIDGTGDTDDTEDLNGLGVGVYNLSVFETPTGCISVASVTLTEPAVLDVTSNVLDLVCFNDNSGGLDITVTGGTLPYNFDWDNLAGTNNIEDQPSINAGTYEITITDDNGCVTIDSYDITQPLEIDITAVITNNDCFGDARGAIDVTVTDGVMPYQFNWDTPSTNQDETLLAAGSYFFTVTDDNNCSRDSLFIITEPNPIIFNAVVTDANCNISDGDINTTVSGGTLTSPDYTYNWNFGGASIATTSNIINQPAGTYIFSVTDDNNCQVDTTVIINNINAPVITLDNITDVTCFGDNNGLINVSVSGGTVPYDYLWNPNGIAQTEDLSNAPADTYSIQVTDAAGCITTLPNLTIDSPSEVTATINPIDATCGICNGEATATGAGGTGTISYLWSSGGTTPNESGLCAGLYTVQVTDNNGCSVNEAVTINNIGGPTGETIVSTDVSCGNGADGTATVTALGGVAPYTYFWPHNGSTNPSQNGLSAGTYFVEMADDNGCIRVAQVDIQEPTVINVTSTINPSTCGNADGDITIIVTGGIAPLTINWTNPAGQTTTGVNGLSAGIYTVIVADGNGCSVTENFTISDIDAPTLTLFPTDALCNGDATGSITSAVSNAVGTISYQWMDAAPTNIGGETNADILTVGTGDYSLVATDAGTGCIVIANATIEEPDALQLSIPNTTDASCDISCDGEATAVISGGSLSYTYLWNSGATTPTATNLCVGINNVTITDANGCIIQQSITVDENFQLDAAVVSTDATCGICNGTAVVTPTGGSGNYGILWSDGTTNLNNTGLCAGIYPFAVTDNTTGCSVQLDATINNIGGPTGEAITITDVTCNGDADGSAQVLPTGGTTPYHYNWLGEGNTTNTLNAVSAGSYVLQVSDDNGCIRMVPIDIVEPTAPNVQSIANDGTCGNADGSITLLVSGGVAPYAYNWTSGPSAVGSVNDTETGLLPGIYTIEITDGSGCLSIETITLGTTNGPALTISNNPVNCNGDADGAATVVAVGSGPFNYAWTSGGATDNETNLAPGQYFVAVTDANGCVSNASTTITSPDELTFALPNVQDASCDIACDGEATVIVSGGTVNYTFQWSGGQTGQTGTGLCVGTNSVTITDANGCSASTSVVVDYGNGITSLVTPTDATCGDCDGEATVAPAGGSGNYSILWYDNTAGTSHTGLCAGIYPYTVTDNDNGCKTDLDVTINNIGGPDNETITTTDVTCAGGADGSANVIPSGGTAPYTLLWVPTGQTTNTLSNVPAGTYNLEVTDDNGCIRVVPVTIDEANPMDVQYIANGTNCGGNDGSIDLVVTGGVTPITYSWAGPSGFTSANSSETNLAPGLYTITITDNNGCVQTAQIPLTTTTPPSASVIATPVSCFGLSDGSLSIISAGLTIEWQDGTLGPNLNGLSGGQYFVTITETATGCINIESGVVNEPDSLALGVQFAADPLCNGDCNGEISAIVDGGTLPYTYAWSSSANTGVTESGLCDGTITMTVTDVNGCTTNTNVTLDEPAILTVVVDNIVDATCVNSQDGSIDVTAAGGVGTLTYSWITTPASTFTSSSEDLTNLDPTTYDLTVTDQNGCTALVSAPVDTIFIVLADAGLDTAFCFNNCAVLQGSGIGPGGLTYEWNSVPVTTPLSTADTLQVCPILIGNGQYTLTVSDANCTHTDSVNVEMYPLPTVDAGVDIEDVLGTPVSLGGSPTGPLNSTYFWTPNTNFLTANDSTVSNPEIELLLEQDYFVFVTDTNGCMNSDTIHVRPIPQIVFPNGFTPNGDGTNDDWQIDYIDQFPESVVEIYNRWGEQLFRSIGYKERWDGTYNNKILPVGTYYYIIELNDPLFPEAYSGPITIMR